MTIKVWTVVNMLGSFCGVAGISFAIYFQWVAQADVPDRIIWGYFIGGTTLTMMHFQVFFPGEWWALALRAAAYLCLLTWESYMAVYVVHRFNLNPTTLTDD